MRNRALAAALGMTILLACDTRDRTQPEPTVTTVPADTAVARDGAHVFIETPPADAQIVFVGRDRSQFPSDRSDAVFVPFSTFSVERDGVPNEFPPADSMEAQLEAAGVGGDRFVVVGDPIPAGRAYAAFDLLGLGDRTSVLDGGTDALPAQPGEIMRNGARAGFDTDVREDMIVDAEWVHERLDDPDVAILDARPPAEFSGETPGEGIDRPGHIPGARNVFWQTLVQSEANPILRDEAELRRLFEQAGVEPDDIVVAYCRTGGQASFLYTVARHLGYDVRLYDGSYIDWSRTDYPVER